MAAASAHQSFARYRFAAGHSSQAASIAAATHLQVSLASISMADLAGDTLRAALKATTDYDARADLATKIDVKHFTGAFFARKNPHLAHCLHLDGGARPDRHLETTYEPLQQHLVANRRPGAKRGNCRAQIAALLDYAGNAETDSPERCAVLTRQPAEQGFQPIE